MKQKLYSLTASLFTKLALVTALIIGWGNTALAEEIVVVNGSTISSDWENGAGNSSYNYTIDEENNKLISSTSSYSRLRSKTTITLSNQRIIAKVKRLSDQESYFILYSGWTATAIKFGYNSAPGGGGNEIYTSDEYIELISDKVTTSSAQLDFRAKNIEIKSIRIVNDEELLLDETRLTALSKGSKTETVRFKYTPKNGWNTFVAPFQLRSPNSTYDHLATIFGSEWKAFTLDSYNEGTLTFTEAAPNSYSAINGNTPILVYTENAQTCPTNGFELTSSITIAYPAVSGSPATTKDGITFQGTFAPKEAGTLTGNYGVTQDGRIAKAGDGASMKGYRAYLTGLPTSGAVKMMVINSDTPTDVGMLQMAEGDDKAVYNLSGQKVKNVTKGLYIINGKKVVVK